MNEIKIEVINSWVNRLIGDQQPGATTLHVCGREAVQGEFAAAAFWFARAGEGGAGKQQIISSPDERPGLFV